MSFELFKKIIDDSQEFPNKIKKLYFHSFGEPLMNRELPNMIKYAKEQDIAENLELITNGSLLNPELNRKLVKAGLDHICISVEALNEKQYMNIAKYKINLEKFILGIKDFYENRGDCTVYIKIADIAINTEEDKKDFFDKFGNICDSIFMENIVNKMVVNSDGTVSPCCVDWKRQLLIGDVKNEKLANICNGDGLHELQLLHIKGKRCEHFVCEKCNFLKYSTDFRDNIDSYLTAILERITK